MTDTNGPDPRNAIGCCDPCSYIRGGGNHYLHALLAHIPGGPPVPGADCCRCIPRALVFRLVPDDYDTYCCYRQSHLVHPVLKNDGDWLRAVYREAAFGLTFEWSVGRFSRYLDASGYEDYDAYDFDAYDYCDDYDPYAIGLCAWRLRVYNGSTLLYYQMYPITGENDCLAPPTVEYGPINYPPGCSDSYVSFDVFDKDKLAYVPSDHPGVDEYSLIDLCPSDCDGETPTCLAVQTSDEVWEYSQIADIGGYPAYRYNEDGTVRTIQWDAAQVCWVMLDATSTELASGGDDSTCPLGPWTSTGGDVLCVSLCDSGAYETEVSFLCGDCTRVCEYVCVSGNWRGNGWEFLQFEWTKQLTTVGTYPNDYTTLKQGWSCANPNADDPDYLWLVDSYGGCQLETDFSDNNFSPIVITSGCGCDLFEGSHTQPWPGDVFWYSVHCGFCTEYAFFCGSCRCVPSHLCLFYSLNGSVAEQGVLAWNESLKQWGDDTSDTFTVHLERGDDRECELVVYYEGDPLTLWIDDVEEDAVSIYDCQKELWPAHSDDEFDHPLGLPDKEGVRLTRRSKCRRSYADWIGVSYEGYINRTSDFLYLHFNSAQDENCDMITCTSFFREACPTACVDQPKTLQATLMFRSGDYGTGYGEEWSIEAELHLVVQYQGYALPTFYCAYIGGAVVACTVGSSTVYEGWTIASQEGGFSWTVYYWEDDNGQLVQKKLTHTFASVVPTVSCSPIYAETSWEDFGPDPATLIRAGLLCTGNDAEEDRPHDCKLILSEVVE